MDIIDLHFMYLLMVLELDKAEALGHALGHGHVDVQHLAHLAKRLLQHRFQLRHMNMVLP